MSFFYERGKNILMIKYFLLNLKKILKISKKASEAKGVNFEI